MDGELDKIVNDLNKLEDAVAEAKAGYISRQILPKEMLERLMNKINSKSRSFHVVFPKERIDLRSKNRNYDDQERSGVFLPRYTANSS